MTTTSQSWWVKANHKVYGPYTLGQMGRFIMEGRVIGSTLVSPKPEGDWVEARFAPSLRGSLHDERTNFHVQPGEVRTQATTANMLIWSDIVTGATFGFENELRKLGPVAQIVPGLFILRSTRTAGVVRNVLSQALGRGDKFMVIDASRDRMAWFNLGPEIDVRIRDVWNAQLGEDPAHATDQGVPA
jgi:hypothetical protein